MDIDLTVWAHEAADFEVYVDPQLIPGAQEGDSAELWVPRTPAQAQAQAQPRPPRRNLYFLIKRPPKPAHAISVNPQVLAQLGVRPRSTVRVRVLPEEARRRAELDVVEIHFAGFYLTRYDHYEIAKTINNRCVSKGQKLSYLAGSVRLAVENLFRGGKQKFSGFVGENTRLVFRSDSARILIFVQMSKEMYNFDETGDIMFHKLVNSFIPEMLHQWHKQGDSHLVSIVLFTSIRVRKKHGGRRLHAGELEPKTLHFYRVVVDSVHISRWSDIMGALRAEFTRFMAEVLIEPDTMELRGTFLPSSKSNLLEAFSLATTLLTNKFIDRDLCHTGVQAMVVTAGPACFDVDLSELWLLSRRLLGVEIGIELVCLARPPLHITPLFRARLPSTEALAGSSRLVFCVPTWINMSFWTSQGRFRKQWIPRCKIYDLQMVGILESEPRTLGLHSNHFEPNDLTVEFMKQYDTKVFRSVNALESQKRVESAAKSATPDQLRPSQGVTNPTVLVEQTGAIAELAEPAARAADSLAALVRKRPSMTTLTPVRSAASASFSRLANSKLANSKPANAKPANSKLPNSRSLRSSVSTSSTSSNNIQYSVAAVGAAAAGSAGLSAAANRLPFDCSPNGPSSAIAIPAASRTLRRTITSSPLMDQFCRSLASSKRKSPERQAMVANLAFSAASAAAAVPSKSVITPSSCEVPLPEYQHEAMWRVLPNSATVDRPSRLKAYGRWANVYPPNVEHNGVSWHSLKSPASLPLTNEGFPSLQSFQEHYQFQFYDIAVDDYDNMPLPLLLDQMIGLRLHMGFQIAVGDRVKAVEVALPRGNPNRVSTIVPETDSECIGLRVYLTRVGLVHRIAVDEPGTVNVRLYTWIDHSIDRLKSPGCARENIVKVKTHYDTHYNVINPKFLDPAIQNLNWSMLDLQLSGADDPLLYPSSANTQNLVSLRFVVLPSESSMMHGHETLSVEEGHVEGITRIVRTMLKNREAGTIDADFLPQYYTGNLRHAINECISSKGDSLLDSDRLNKQISLEDLAVELQGPMGLEFKDRRWHWKQFSNVFIGHDFVVWLIKTFEDINTTEEAEAYGADLMKRGFIRHPENRHPFIHGHYFYEITSNYTKSESSKSVSSAPHSSTTVISGRGHVAAAGGSDNKTDRHAGGLRQESDSVGPSNSLTPPSPNTSSFATVAAPAATSDSIAASATAASGGSTAAATTGDSPSQAKKPTKGKVHISGSFVMNIDPRGISRKPERVKVSIDRTHNPKNAYHIMLEWLSATPRLIDDYFSSLGRLAAPYGLRLVQVPVANVLSTLRDSPFRSALTLDVNIDLPNKEDSRWFRHYLLRCCGYIQDLQDSKDINTEEYEVLFMWGRVGLEFPQYIHKSGYILVQLAENGTLKVTPNTLHLSRSVMSSATGGATSAEQECEQHIGHLKDVCENREVLQSIVEEWREWSELPKAKKDAIRESRNLKK